MEKETDDFIKKVIDTYLHSPLNTEKQAKLLHIGKPKYRAILKENFTPTLIETREQAWDLYRKVQDENTYYRYIGKSLKEGKMFLLSLAISNEELRNLVEVKGIPMVEIVTIIDMPFIDYKFIHDRLNRLSIKYNLDVAKENRRKGSKKFYSNEEAVKNQTEKRKSTNISRYGTASLMANKKIRAKQEKTMKKRYGVRVSTMSKEVQKKQQATSLKNNGVPFPAQSKEIYAKVKATNYERYGADSYITSNIGKNHTKSVMLEKYGHEYALQSESIRKKAQNTNQQRYGFPFNSQLRISFSPTEYVSSIEQSISIMKNADTLYEFLSTKLPDKTSFTLHEISLITGRSYNFVSTRFSTALPFINQSVQGHLPEYMQNFLEELGYTKGKDFIVNDRKAIAPLEIDFYFPKEKVGIEVNDLATHNTTTNVFGGEVKDKNYHMNKSLIAKQNGIRLIHAWEHYFDNPQQLNVLKNAIKHALGISKNRVYARNTYVKEVPNVILRDFFNENNIQGFRGAKTAYALFDKKTDEVLMAYSVGSSHFAHSKYDLELIRGASKLDTTIVGGASKLWKFIIDSNPDVNSIVYYIDRNIYNGSSIKSLEGHIELVSTQSGFWNYFVVTNEIKNRQPGKHKEIQELVKQGKVWEVYNAGTETYVWNRDA